MGYVFPWLYYDDNISEWNNFTYTSNATGANIQDVIAEICKVDLFSINHLWWIISTIVIMVLYLNTFIFK